MKKILLFVLSILLIVSLIACESIDSQGEQGSQGVQGNDGLQKTYDEIISLLENAFDNGKEQNYWSVKTYVGGNVVSEYNKDNSPSQEFTDAIFDIHHDRLIVAQILSSCTQSNFILTTTDGQITITTIDCPDGAEMLMFVIEDELIKSYSMYADGNEFKSIFTYEK